MWTLTSNFLSFSHHLDVKHSSNSNGNSVKFVVHISLKYVLMGQYKYKSRQGTVHH